MDLGMSEQNSMSEHNGMKGRAAGTDTTVDLGMGGHNGMKGRAAGRMQRWTSA
jgi:hypothetical protein